LVFQKAKLCVSPHRQSRVCGGRELLCSTPLDAATLEDYGVHCEKVALLCDNESAIKIAHNPVQHNKTKHIEIQHHFIQDHVNRGDINLSYVGTNDQLADIFTKTLDEARF
jgi:hypothetical protein